MDDRKCYRCVKGPLHGHMLWLATRSTAVLRIGKRVGRYVANACNTKVIWERLN